MPEAHNRMIAKENNQQLRGIAAQFWARIGWPLKPQIPLHDVPPPLADDNNEDKLGLE
jgi:hypothetical protein